MADPYTILDVPPESSDEAIRRRYLTLVRTYTPERAPERFAAIREAYEKLRDPQQRLRYRLFEAGKEDSLEAILADAKASVACRRVPLAELLALGRKHA
jgi:curved DNA-binding protein CbpA